MSARGDAVLVLGADDGPLQRGLGASRRRVQTWGGLVAADINKSFQKGLSSLTTLTGFAGVGLFASQARDVIKFEDGLSKLGVSARLNQYQMAALGEKIREAGMATGVSSEEILGGVQSYVALTGDVKTATASLDVFARAAQATSTPMSEIAKTAAALSINLGITSDEMEQALSGIHSQGKAGAVEFNEMAGIVSNLAPRFAMFNTVGVKGLAEMNGLLQSMRVGFGTTGEAATSLEAVMGALTDSQTIKRLGDVGVKAFTKDKAGVRHMRDLRDIIADIIVKTKGDPITISTIFGRKEAVAGITKLFQQGQGTIDNMIAAASRGGEIGEDFGKRLQSPAVKLAQAKERLNKVFDDALVRNLDTIVAAVEKLVDAINWMVQNKGAVIAMFAAIKGGGYLGGVGAQLGGGAGAMGMGMLGAGGAGGGRAGAGAWGAYGGAASAAARRRGMAANALAYGGGALQGAALGFGAYQIGSAMGMSGFNTAVFTASSALSALPGPLGILGKTVSFGTAAIDAFFGSLNAGIDDLNKRIFEGKYGEHGVIRATEFARSSAALSDNPLVAQARRAGLIGSGAGAAEEQRKASNYLFRTAQESGALSADMAEGKPRFTLDRTVLQEVLKNEVMSDAEREAIIAQTVAAVAQANSGAGAIASEARQLFGLGRAPQLVKVEVGFSDGKPLVNVVQNDRRHRRKGK